MNNILSKKDRYCNFLKDFNKIINSLYANKKMDMNKYIRLALLLKYNKSTKAIYRLDTEGFYEDANILLRTVFETVATVMYCEINPDNLYKRFFDYNALTRLEYVEYDSKIKEIMQVIYGENINELKKSRENFKKKYKTTVLDKWSGISFSKMCKKLDKFYNTDFYTNMYFFIYKDKSNYIHSNITTLFERYIEIEDKKLVMNYNPERDDNNFEIIETLEEFNREFGKLVENKGYK